MVKSNLDSYSGLIFREHGATFAALNIREHGHTIKLGTRLSEETLATPEKAFGISDFSLRRRVEHVGRQHEMSQEQARPQIDPGSG